jgi:hypothetical protein
MKLSSAILASVCAVGLSYAAGITSDTAVIARSEQFARAIGKKLTGSAKTTSIARQRSSDARTVGVSWGEAPLFGVVVDAQTLRVLEARDLTTFESSEAKAKVGEPTKVDREQALSLARAAVGASGAEPGDWRVTHVSWYEPKVPGADPSKHWKIWFNRYEGGYGSEWDSIYVKIAPYEPIVEYFYSEAATRLPVTGKPIAVGQAQMLAKDAFRRMGDGWLKPTADVKPSQPLPGAAWKAISGSSNVSRLAYTYLFDVKTRDYVGSSESSDRIGAGVEVVVDALTSEIWWAKVVTGGQAGGHPTLLPRIRLAAQLLGDPATEALGRALGACNPAPGRDSDMDRVKARRYGSVEFGLTLDGRLSWREGDSTGWNFGTLSAGESEKVRAFLPKVPDLN